MVSIVANNKRLVGIKKEQFCNCSKCCWRSGRDLRMYW